MAEPLPMLPQMLRVVALEAVDSTQDAMRRQLAGDAEAHGMVIRAAYQTGGRGRLERAWHSDPGGSYQTVALADRAGQLRSGRVPVALAVGVAAALSDQGTEVGVKWPNDLYLRSLVQVSAGYKGRLAGKVGGILCEHVQGHLLVGVGINVENTPPTGAAALRGLRRELVSDLVIEGIREGLKLVSGGELPEHFARRDVLAGRFLTVQEGARQLRGLAAGISAEGCLLLQGEVELLKTCSGRITNVDAAT